VGDAEGAPSSVKSGVPQGTVLGPLIFSLYANDLPDVVTDPNVSVSLFADDAKIYAACPKSTATNNNLQNSLKSIHDWSKIWQLSLSLPKCSVFCFGKCSVEPVYALDSAKLNVTSEAIDLGVLLSRSCKSTSHCTKIYKKSASSAALIFRAFHTRSKNFLMNMFQTYVRPTVMYNSPCWSPYLLKDIHILERVQRSYTKRIPGLRNLTYSDRLATLGIESLEELRLRADLVLAYKIIRNKIDLKFDDFFKYNNVDHRLRAANNLQLKIPFSRLDPSVFFFCRRIPRIWNTLPQDIVDSPSIDKFKQNLKGFDFSPFLRGRDK
jgi:ribonuclease P/MRP protein subunit RPP40